MIFDPLLGYIESFTRANEEELQANRQAVDSELLKLIEDRLPTTRSRLGQFRLIRQTVEAGVTLFSKTAAGIPKESLMSIARRAPSSYLDGADLVLAKLIVKFAIPDPNASFHTTARGDYSLGLVITDEQIYSAFRLMAIASRINRLGDMGRWLGKGGHLVFSTGRGLRVEVPEDVREAVNEYESRRPKLTLFDSGGFFIPELDPEEWGNFRIPLLIGFKPPQFVESPLDSKRWLYFDRLPVMVDGGGLARVLRGYDEALKECWGVGADHILHFLTALATLIGYTSPSVSSLGQNISFEAEPPEIFEEKIQFMFGLARKGFLRLPAQVIARNIGRVSTVIAPDSATAERLGEEFLDAFLLQPDRLGMIDESTAIGTPFLHPSTEENIYIDLLLLPDFLVGVLEAAKNWYASQHGDRFVLDLKRWLDRDAPGSVVGARIPVTLETGGRSDVDLLLKWPKGFLVVECKAYGKSQDFMIGAPDAVSRRRARIRKAVQQAERIATVCPSGLDDDNLVRLVEGQEVTGVVCTPSVEFLLPLGEYGMASDSIPKVMTPEELIELALSD